MVALRFVVLAEPAAVAAAAFAVDLASCSVGLAVQECPADFERTVLVAVESRSVVAEERAKAVAVPYSLALCQAVVVLVGPCSILVVSQVSGSVFHSQIAAAAVAAAVV